MMLGHPEPLAAERLGGAGEIGGGGEGLAERAAFADRDEIEHGKLGHAGGSSCLTGAAGPSCSR